jgi:hypothetical protein
LLLPPSFVLGLLLPPYFRDYYYPPILGIIPPPRFFLCETKTFLFYMFIDGFSYSQIAISSLSVLFN